MTSLPRNYPIKNKESQRCDIIVSLSTVKEWKAAADYDADILEIRLDLVKSASELEKLEELCNDSEQHTIVTLRSKAEGGVFDGSGQEWFERIKPWLNSECSFIDIEQRYSGYAKSVKQAGKTVIASVHMRQMTKPVYANLIELQHDLLAFGDIAKIAAAPADMTELAEFIKFTTAAKKPVITSIMGEKFREGRIMLALAGSGAVFCHAGKPASAGQYHIEHMSNILKLIYED